jgi:hypothetical protein
MRYEEIGSGGRRAAIISYTMQDGLRDGLWAFDEDPDDAILVSVVGAFAAPVATFRCVGWMTVRCSR